MSSPRPFAHLMSAMTIAEIEKCGRARMRDAALELGITTQYVAASLFNALSARDQASAIYDHFRKNAPDPLPAEMDEAVADELMEKFGADHWNLLLYVETRCVDYGGRSEVERMRCNPHRHPARSHRGSAGWEDEHHSTRWAGGIRLVQGHDDWDCLDDLAAAGLVVALGVKHEFDGIAFSFKLTDKGWTKAHELRRARAERLLSKRTGY